MKKFACFYEPQFGRISLNFSLSDSVLETKRLQAKQLNSICRTIMNYSNRDSDWLIVACFIEHADVTVRFRNKVCFES